MAAAIRTLHLTRRFAGQPAVDALSMTVPAGSVYGFLGRNGAGKTTTLKLLLGLLRPDAGRIEIDGIDVLRQRSTAARRVGALLEAQGFYAQLSGRQNLDLARRLLGLPADEVQRVLALTDLLAPAHRPVSAYSLGMRQRLGLARALLGAPPVLLLDEPSNGLDPEGIAWMRAFLRELPARTGATVLLSSHLLGEIEQTASHVGILDHGRLVVEGPLAGLMASQPAGLRIETDANPRAAELARQHGLQVDHDADALQVRLPRGADPRAIGAMLNHALCAAGVRVHALVPQRPSLEQLYRGATQPVAA